MKNQTPSTSALLGKGSFSEVSLVKFQGKLSACKAIKLPAKSTLENILDQINILKGCKHPNIVKFYKIMMPSFSRLNLYLEYIDGWTLDIAYQKYKNEEILFYWIFQICLGLHYLSTKNIVHRDIKPQNIIVDKKGIVKLLDFGLAKILVNHYSEIIGTPYFIAPQIFSKHRVYDKSDIWSLGISIYYLLFGKNPFITSDWELEQSLRISKQKDRILEKEEKNKKKKSSEKYFSYVLEREVRFDRKCSKEMRQLLSGMLTKDSDKRLSAYEIINHRVMKQKVGQFKASYLEGIKNEESSIKQ